MEKRARSFRKHAHQCAVVAYTDLRTVFAENFTEEDIEDELGSEEHAGYVADLQAKHLLDGG